MRAEDFLLEYDRSRTERIFTAYKIVTRPSSYDWRNILWTHWEGTNLRDWEEFYQVCWKEASRHRDNPDWIPGQRDENGYWKDTYSKWVVKFTMELCEQADPTAKNKFVPVILRWWLTDSGMRYMEDIEKAYEPLATFIKFKNRIKDIDLTKIGFNEFCDRMDAMALIPSGSEEDKAMMKGFFDRGEAHLLVDNDRVRVVVPNTEDAAKYFGRNTRWCTSGKRGNQFKSYNDRGPLFIILFKAENARWQWHFPTMQFMDEKDIRNEETNVKHIVPKFPELMKIWDEGMRSVIGWSPSQILKMFQPTYEDYNQVFFRGSEPWDKRDVEGIKTRVRNVLRRSPESWALVKPADDPTIKPLIIKAKGI